MAMNIEIEVDGVDLEAIENLQDVAIELNFDRDKDSFTQQTTIKNLESVLDLNEVILQKIDDGITGLGAGIYEGIPLKIKINKGTDVEIPFNGYIDLTDNPDLSCMRSDVNIVEKHSIDWLNDVADGFTFEYLYKESGEITDADFRWMPYVLNSVPNYKEAAISLLSVFFIQQQIEAAIEKISELGVEMSNPFEATSIVRAVLFIIYLIALIASLIVLIKTIILLIIQPVKYHAGMYAYDLCVKGALHLGYTFKSHEILQSTTFKDLFIIPQKTNSPVNPSENKIFGFTTPGSIEQQGFFKGTFGDFLRAMKSMFDGKILVTDAKEIYLVPQMYNVAVPLYQLPDLYQPKYTYNSSELKSNYLISFATDVIDKNTIQNWNGTSYQIITKPNTITNSEMVLLKNVTDVQIPLALVTRKEDLTIPEQIVKAFLNVIDTIVNALISAINAVIDVYNKIVKGLNKIIDALDFIGIDVGWEIPTINNIPPINLSGLIDNRIGMLIIEIDQLSQPKVFLMAQGSQSKFNKVYTTNRTIVSAKYLWENFHYVNSMVPTASRPNGNQYMIKSFENVPFTYQNYTEVKGNNRIFDASGNEAYIDSLKWSILKRKAEMTVRFSQIFTNNLKQILIEQDGK